MTFDENSIIEDEDANGNKIKRKMTPEEVKKYNKQFGYIDFPNQNIKNAIQVLNQNEKAIEPIKNRFKDISSIIESEALKQKQAADRINQIIGPAINSLSSQFSMQDSLINALQGISATTSLQNQFKAIQNQISGLTSPINLIGGFQDIIANSISQAMQVQDQYKYLENIFAPVLESVSIVHRLTPYYLPLEGFSNLARQLEATISSLNPKINIEKILNSKSYLDSFKQGLTIDIELSQTNEKTVRNLEAIRKFESRKAFVDEIEDEFEIQAEEIQRLTTQVLNVDGKPSRVLLVPVDKYDEVSSFYNQISITETSEIKTSVKLSFKGVKNPNQDSELIFKYNSKTGYLTIGPYPIKINKTGRIHAILSVISCIKFNLQKDWMFDELLEIIDQNYKYLFSKDDKPIKAKIYQDFKYIIRKLPKEIKDLFILTTKTICITEKYLPKASFSP